jgi:hypothetical protein
MVRVGLQASPFFLGLPIPTMRRIMEVRGWGYPPAS